MKLLQKKQKVFCLNFKPYVQISERSVQLIEKNSIANL